MKCPLLMIPAMLLATPFVADAAVKSIQQERDGVLVLTDSDAIFLRPWSEATLQVEAAPGGKIPEKHSFAVVARPQATGWKFTDGADSAEFASPRLKVAVNKADASLTFLDADGKVLTKQESWGFQPAADAKRNGLETSATFAREDGERFFGGGVIGDQFRQPGTEINLQNDYLQMHIPMLFSTRGYGIFWDNPSRSKLSITPGSVTWKSPAGDLGDYFIFAGPSADQVVAQYRQLTGAVPMLPKWAYGFWFCKNAFGSQQEIIDAAKAFRERQMPIDMLVQDYFYWRPSGADNNWIDWGTHEFVKDRYPDPKGMIQELHEEFDIHFMVVIWAKFAPGLAHTRELDSMGGLLPEHGDWAGKPLRYYDPFNPKAREIYTRQIMNKLLTLDVDGLWMDGVEPEMGMDKFDAFDTAAGPGSRVFNAYPLVHVEGITKALRARSPDKRAVLLPRSAWAGSQRTPSIAWTSDVNMDWETLAWQIEGLQNFSILGLPYITTDIGGFKPTPENDAELFLRWFQWGTFSPIFRVHGAPRSYPWEYGEEAFAIMKEFDTLRYRLLPYIYTQAGLITHASGTMLRPLVMDYADDPKAVEAWDEFLFGPSILVCPVYQSVRAAAVAIDQITDNDGKPGRVTATFTPEVAGESSFEITDDFGFAEVAGKRLKSVGFSLKNLKDEHMKAETVRVEGTFTPAESGALQIETSGIGSPKAEGVSVEIDGRTIEPTSPVSDWHFPVFPFQAEAGRPVKFAVVSRMKNLGIRIVKPLPEPIRRDVYLPAKTAWFDFWTGKKFDAGQTMSVETPLARIPLYVPAGSILPMGPELQYADEKPADPIELRVYRGGNGEFTLYEDEGDGYGYEKGAYATIPMKWDEAAGTLTIGPRRGTFPGMLKTRTFRVVWVGENHGAGVGVTADADKEVTYTGETLTVTPED